MAMRHVHYDDWAGARVPGYLPLGAYHRLLASIPRSRRYRDRLLGRNVPSTKPE